MSDSTSQRLAASPQQRRALQASAAQEFLGAAYGIEGELTQADVTRALGQLGQGNEILRTDVEAGASGAAQLIGGEARVLVGAESSAATSASAALLSFITGLTSTNLHVAARLCTIAGKPHLLLAQPRAIADARSLDVLAHGIITTLSGKEPAQPRDEDGAVLQYADLSALQEELLADEDSADARAHLESLALDDCDKQRLGLERPLGSGSPRIEFQRTLTEDEGQALRDIATRAGSARSAVALAAWALVISRQADRPAPIIALASEGRDYEGLDVALGPFEKHVPLSLGASDDGDFCALTKRALASLDRALDDHDAWDAATDSAPDLIPHAFAWRTAFDVSAGGRRLWTSARLGQSDNSRVTVAFEGLSDGPGSDCLVLRVSAASDAMDQAAAEAVADQVLALILDAKNNPSTSAANQSAASAAWCTQVTESLSHVPSGSPGAATITELLTEAALASPNATAVRGKDLSLTYSELDTRTNRIARHLRTLGVGPGKFVGLYFERDAQMVEAMLGVLKAGGAYLPLPPTYPDDRVCFMLEDTAAAVVMTSTLSSGGLPNSSAQVLILDQLASELSSLESGPLDAQHGSDDPAYVIFTSGSTGKPKGVPITHGNLCHSTLARSETYGEPISAYLLLSSFAFDSSVAGIFWTLTGGGTLVLPPEGTERELGQLPKLVKEHAISHLLSLPSVYGLLLESAKDGELNSLQVVIVAGESATPELVARHGADLPGCALFDEYGPTENTVWSTVQRCSTDDAFFTVPIGRPVPGVRAFVAEADSDPPKPVAAGMPGELLVGGPQLSPGYLGRPELTAERFIGGVDGQRLYRTGDLARMHPGGTLEFLGRLDHQVKLRGYRIELEEIEAVLADRDEVQEAVVDAPDFASEGHISDRRLVAYVLGAKAAIDVDSLRAHLAQRLPEYMVPAHIVVLDELPRLPNGKVDRRALPLPTAEGHGSGGGVDSAASALERLIAHLWAELLECDAVGSDEDFFDLGGHSLLAARFFAQLNETLQVEAPLRYLFDNPTVRGLAAAIGNAVDDGPRATRAAEIAVQLLGLDGADEASSSTALERLVGSLWAAGLAVDSVDPEEDFFDLGGHSLLAARLFAQMNELLQVEAPLRLLFDNPTVRSLCAGLSDGDTAEAARLERTAELTLQVMESE